MPLETYIQKFTNMRFEPAGMTDDPDIRIAQSVMDYIFRRLALDHLPVETRAELGIFSAEERAAQVAGSYGTSADGRRRRGRRRPGGAAQSAPIETPARRPRRRPPSRLRSEAHSSTELLEVVTGHAPPTRRCA